MQKYPCFLFSRKCGLSQKVMKDAAKKNKNEVESTAQTGYFSEKFIDIVISKLARHTMFNQQLVYTTMAPEYKSSQLLRSITGWGRKNCNS